MSHVKDLPVWTWQQNAACAEQPDLPWLSDHTDVSEWQAATMQAVCRECPVLANCRAAVAELDVTGGWWAGQDQSRRRQISDRRRRRRRAVEQHALPLRRGA